MKNESPPQESTGVRGVKRKSDEMENNWKMKNVSEMFSSFLDDSDDDFDDFDIPPGKVSTTISFQHLNVD